MNIRKINGLLLVPVMKVTGFRFSRDFRMQSEYPTWRGFVYRWVDTVGANIKAGL